MENEEEKKRNEPTQVASIMATGNIKMKTGRHSSSLLIFLTKASPASVS